ncbi:MAG: hypothetical protein ACTSPW_07135 [Promethearchaeota archaeon]
MLLSEYSQNVAEAIEYLIALGSLIGYLGIICGFLLFLSGVRGMKQKGIFLIIFSICIVAFCGGSFYGLKYFRIYH